MRDFSLCLQQNNMMEQNLHNKIYKTNFFLCFVYHSWYSTLQSRIFLNSYVYKKCKNFYTLSKKKKNQKYSHIKALTQLEEFAHLQQ